jgi:hypothetical protein
MGAPSSCFHRLTYLNHDSKIPLDLTKGGKNAGNMWSRIFLDQNIGAVWHFILEAYSQIRES